MNLNPRTSTLIRPMLITALGVCLLSLNGCASKDPASVDAPPRYKYVAVTGSRIRKVVDMNRVREQAKQNIEVIEDREAIRRSLRRSTGSGVR